MNYDEFIKKKSKDAIAAGFEPREITAPLFDWQAHVARWAIRTGRAALFEDCGLGKTAQQLEFADQVCKETGGSVLILTPLSVAAQTIEEARKFGIVANIAETGSEVRDGIWVTNYEKLDKFGGINFAGVVLDESSILKNFNGKTRTALTERFSDTPYKLCCTATPSPNDYTEFGQHAEFLGVCSSMQMLSTFFINDTFNTGDWRLKKHAEKQFWQWVASWAACISKPSDIGFSDDGYNLPALNLQDVIVDVDEAAEAQEGELFRNATLSATTMHKEMRLTAEARVSAVADLVNNSDEAWVVWCNTNDESERLGKAIPGSVEVKGSDTSKAKQSAAAWFLGHQCICGLKPNKNRDKLAACGNPNTPSRAERNIIPTQLREIGEGPKGEVLRKMPNICGSITPIIPKNSSGRPSRTKSETSPAERTTQKMSLPELRPGSPQENGRIKTRKSDSLKDSSPMELLQENTKGFSNLREEGAQSAEPLNHETIQSDQKLGREDFTSTTVTKAERLEESSAHAATLDSESSRMTPSCSNAPQCSCGHISGRRILISKSSIFGYGMNWQHCHNVAFVGLSYSFEDFYQALRRTYRFGQKKQVNAYIIQATTEGAIMQNIRRKIGQHANMQEQMKIAADSFSQNSIKKLTMKTDTTITTGEGFRLYHGDCVRVAKMQADHSVDFSVFSPPFADLFTYSDDLQDMGNCKDTGEFMQHFEILIAELARIMVPGREVAVHCVDLLSSKWKHGRIEFQDFSGEIIRAFWRHGFRFHSRITIWKSPVTEMQRTKAHGLLYKTLTKDSADSRVGAPDYLLAFRAPGENPKPVTKDRDKYSVDWWQEVASPVWMTVDQGNVLNKDGARDHKDEKHICPLQLDVIERAVELWTNEGDTVYSPFTGIGSEGVVSLRMNRQFIGSELKESYFNQAAQNLKIAKSQLSLFELASA
jgi:DNA modification methylase